MNKKIISIGLAASMLAATSSVVYAENEKTLMLTGSLYNYINNQYVLEVPNLESLKNLDGRKLGFIIKTVSGQETSEETTPILGVICDSLNLSSNGRVIFRAMQDMLVDSSDKTHQTFRLGASATSAQYRELENLFNTELRRKVETLEVTYYDNRLNGDCTTQTKVLYKFGTKKVTKSSSGFAMPNKDKAEPEKESAVEKNTEQAQRPKEKKIDKSEIMSELRSKDVAEVKLDETTKQTVVSKQLLSELMIPKNQKKTVVIEKQENQKLVYRWTLPAVKINRKEKFDIEIKRSNEEVDRVVRGLLKNYRVISFVHKGNLPVISKVEVAIDTAGLDLSSLTIYSIDTKKGQISKTKRDFKIENGILVLENIGYGDDYIIANEK